MKKVIMMVIMTAYLNAFSIGSYSTESITIPKIEFKLTITSVVLVSSGIVVAVVGSGILIPTLGIAAGTGAISTVLIGGGLASTVEKVGE